MTDAPDVHNGQNRIKASRDHRDTGDPAPLPIGETGTAIVQEMGGGEHRRLPIPDYGLDERARGACDDAPHR
jgi:hypothetical protein